MLAERVLAGLAFHADPAAALALVHLGREGVAEELRAQSLFWLAQTGDPRAARWIREAITRDPAREVREQGVFALSQLADATPELLALLRESADREVKRQAIFWLGQSDDPRATAELFDALEIDGSPEALPLQPPAQPAQPPHRAGGRLRRRFPPPVPPPLEGSDIQIDTSRRDPMAPHPPRQRHSRSGAAPNRGARRDRPLRRRRRSAGRGTERIHGCAARRSWESPPRSPELRRERDGPGRAARATTS